MRVNARGSALRLENVERSPSFRLALFADCQYADKENQTRDDGSGRVKFFREAKRRLADAFDAFDARASELSGIVNLGDLFDGYNDDDKTTRPVLRGEMREETREKIGETWPRRRRYRQLFVDASVSLHWKSRL